MGRFNNWREIIKDTHLSLAPRGFGRASYHLMEFMQKGYAPIHVYTDTPWVPYPDIFERLGFVAQVDELPGLLERIYRMENEGPVINEMETRIKSYRDTHFTHRGVIEQILQFMMGDRHASGEGD